MRFRPILLVTALLLIATGCLGDSATNVGYPLVPIESTTFAPSLGVNLAASRKTTSGMYIRDIRLGTGTEIVTGQRVYVKYAGYFANGVLFESGVYPDSTKVPGLRVGAGEVIQGWDEGLLGMRIGGSRQLVIPSSLAYGPSGSGPIPPNATLVFTVEPL